LVDWVAVGGLGELLGSDLALVALADHQGRVVLAVTEGRVEFADPSFQVVLVQTQLASLGGGSIDLAVVQLALFTDIVQQVESGTTSQTLQRVGGDGHCGVVGLAVGNHWKTLEIVTGEQKVIGTDCAVVLGGIEQFAIGNVGIDSGGAGGGGLEEHSLDAPDTGGERSPSVVDIAVVHFVHGETLGTGEEVEAVETLDALLGTLVGLAIGNEVLGVFLADIVAEVESLETLGAGLVVGEFLAIGHFCFDAEFLVVDGEAGEVGEDLVLVDSGEVLGFFLEVVLVVLLGLEHRVVVALDALVERVGETAGGFLDGQTGPLVDGHEESLCALGTSLGGVVERAVSDFQVHSHAFVSCQVKSGEAERAQTGGVVLLAVFHEVDVFHGDAFAHLFQEVEIVFARNAISLQIVGRTVLLQLSHALSFHLDIGILGVA